MVISDFGLGCSVVGWMDGCNISEPTIAIICVTVIRISVIIAMCIYIYMFDSHRNLLYDCLFRKTSIIKMQKH